MRKGASICHRFHTKKSLIDLYKETGAVSFILNGFMV